MYYLNLKPGNVIFEGTLGGAGHTVEIIKAIAPTGKIIGVDLDSQAISTATSNLSREGFLDYAHLIKDNFSNVIVILKKLGVDGIDGFLLDLGLSSIQVDFSGRGFSYMRKEKLDMRFDKEAGLDAYDVINNYTREQLKDIFYRYGQERWSALIAKNIVNYRKTKPVEYTDELVEIIKRTIPEKFRIKGHPAKRIFQALRIAVNDELDNLNKALENGLEVLKPGGRIVVISYHSLEDRIVKRCFERFSGKCTCQGAFPVCICGAVKNGRIITKKPVRPQEEEIIENQRAKSAKLRVFEKI